jgi:hypothetical protein
MFLPPVFSRRRQTPPDATVRADRRSGAPVRRRPEPMPRMRWHA